MVQKNLSKVFGNIIWMEKKEIFGHFVPTN